MKLKINLLLLLLLASLVYVSRFGRNLAPPPPPFSQRLLNNCHLISSIEYRRGDTKF